MRSPSATRSPGVRLSAGLSASRATALVTILLITLPVGAARTAEPVRSDAIAQAVAHPARSDGDRARDQHSHPEAVLNFLAVQPGMVVVDLLGGDGYYSEILARAVGPDGRVYLHNNQGYAGLMRSLPRRLQGPDLDALEIYVREFRDFQLASDSVDLVLMVKVYHDLYYQNNGWAVGPDQVFDTVHRILKPGGVLAVIDHRAPADTGPSYAQNLHRIAPDFTRSDIEARGFRFDGESDVLGNSEDDLSRSVFEADLRGRTDRFLHRYEKVTGAAPEQ